ncbi:MAG: TonB-dependent receptor [Opitutales bacterium]|nr:TonB-dependent receptor [Opitutales bacterium]
MSKKLSEKKWWHTIALASAVIATLPLTSYAQDTGEEDLEELETFTMVGSRIKRIDAEPINPVVTRTKEDLEASGFSTLSEAVRSLSFNSGQSLGADTGSSTFGYGAKTVNFRGIGDSNVLMLVNGRRAAPFGASAGSGYDTVFDLDSLPASAIESINVLKDGGSAVYGSDAVSGVVDVRLRKDFEGMNTTLKVGNFDSTDGMLIAGSVIMGTSTADTSIVVSADYKKQSSVFARDLDWQGNSVDYRPYYQGNSDALDYFGANYPDRRSSYSFPATVTVIGSDVIDDGRYTYASPTSNPTIDGAVESDGSVYGRYDYAADYGYMPKEEIYGFYASARHNITDSLYAFLEVSYRTASIDTDSAPTPFSTSSEHGDAADGSMYLPADNPYNPFGVDITQMTMRVTQAGNRITNKMVDTPRFLAGLGGDFGGDWTWETAALWTKSKVTDENYNLYDDRVQAALHGVDLEDNETGLVTTMWLNPFGLSNEEVIDYIGGYDTNVGSNEVYNYDFSTSGTIVELPAGPLGIAAGTEYREERFSEVVSSANSEGNVVGGSWFSSSAGYRNVLSLYTEATIPVTTWMELQLAGRYEDYNDFGDTTKPKVAIKIRPIESVLFRASFGQSFRAPDLAYLYTSEKVTFTSRNYEDPLRPDDAGKQIEQHGGGNPDLEPEETDTYYVGVAWEPSGFLEGLHMSLDYVQFETDNLITSNGGSDYLRNEATALEYTQSGDIVRAAPALGETYGKIVYIKTSWINEESRTYRGLDFDVSYDWKTENYGRFTVASNSTWTIEYSESGTEYTGSEYYPKWTSTLGLDWNYGDWIVNTHAHYVSSRNGEAALYDEPEIDGYTTYGSQLTVNAGVTYKGFDYFDIKFNVENLFDDEPPLSLWGDFGTSTGLVYTKPRFWSVTLSRDW